MYLGRLKFPNAVKNTGNVLPLIVGYTIGITLFLGGVTAVQVSAQESAASSGDVDFEKSVLPIFAQRCFQCHSGEQADGDLRLDNESDVLFGGHTGQQILGSHPDESELFLRITSSEEGHRMPKEGKPLSESEIAVIKRWIEQGARWNTPTANQPASSANEQAKSLTQQLADRWLQVNDAMKLARFQNAALASIPLALYVVFLLISYRSRRRRASSDSPPKPRRFVSRCVSLTALILFVIVVFQYGWVQELRIAHTKLESKRSHFSIQKPPPVDPEKFTLPPYPMHPKRLGGVYYRGNDERSPNLFNGGFYRTAKLEVWLIDSEGKRFAWHDPLPDRGLFIQLLIERASGTTRALFSDDVLKTTYLRHFPQAGIPRSQPETDAPAETFAINVMTPGEKWETRIPIGKPSEWSSEFAEGMIYLYYGAMMIDGHPGRIHLGIKYNIQPDDQEISSDSEIWMGSLYNLNGRVFVPTKKIILLDRWFDFRPIPEIQGTNTVDPALLGIPEHVKQE